MSEVKESVKSEIIKGLQKRESIRNLSMEANQIKSLLENGEKKESITKKELIDLGNQTDRTINKCNKELVVQKLPKIKVKVVKEIQTDN